MTVAVKNNSLGFSAKKARLVANLIRGKRVSEAMQLLRYNEKREISLAFVKLINSGLTIADQTSKYDLDNLRLVEVLVDEGPTLKRIMPRAQGRAFRINKRSSKISIKIDEKK